MSEAGTATITAGEGFKTINDLLNNAKGSVDDTYLYGTLLSAKKSFGVRIYNKMSPYNSSKKGRYDTDAKYDRYLLFRETCSGKGGCFVIMFDTSYEFSNFYKRTNACIGDVVKIAEPNPIMSFVSSAHDLPVVKPNVIEDCEVIDMDKEGLTTMVISNDIIEPPIGKTLSFRMEKVKLCLDGCKMVESNCKGFFCDMQKNTCACAYTEQVADWVLQAGITLDASATKISFKSWRMTKIFLDTKALGNVSLSVFMEKKVRSKVRNAVTEIVNAVNDKGGWSIVGWARTGEMADASDENNKVASDTIHPHIVWMAPTTYDGFANLKMKDVDVA